MDLANALKKETNKTYTENGAVAYKSTLNSLLDYFSQLSSFKYDTELGLDYFKKAYQEDRLLAMKSLFYTRNIRGTGQGLRAVTREIYKWLATNHTEDMRINLDLVKEFGRIDDYYAFVGTVLEQDAMNILVSQVKEDVKSEHPSLAGKWLASINTSSAETRKNARITANYLHMNAKEYRQLLSSLRKKIDVVEKKMCAKEFDKINYENVPSKAMLNYECAFRRNDSINFNKYLESVKSGEKKINAGAIYPYEIMRKGRLRTGRCYLVFNSNDTLEASWNSLPNYVEGATKTLVVADTSGSMEGNPLNVAISLGLYFASHNSGVWKDKLITFSSTPSFVDLTGANTLEEKVERIPSIIEDTNIEAVFDLILDSAVKYEVSQEEMPENIVIVSDMQFNRAVKDDNDYTQIIKKKYDKAGYKVPGIVYWNVNEGTRLLTHATYDENGVKLVSGFSPSVFKEVVTNTDANPLETMLEILNDEIFDKVKVA